MQESDRTNWSARGVPGIVLAMFMAAAIAFGGSAFAQSRNLAPGFAGLAKGARVVVMPIDVELFSISGGGVPEPKADWTESASRHFLAALHAKKSDLELDMVELREHDADELSEINTLHAAVARAIALHHFGGSLNLPTKDGKLNWSMGEAVRVIKEKAKADYAIFNWIRDSYASSERKAAMVVMALLGVGLVGGMQIGYSSLVDLNTGQILWFNRLFRGGGDLREAHTAGETLNALLEGFPLNK